MKFRSYFLLSIVVGVAFACSSNEDIPEVHVFTPDATLSLTAGTGEKDTKAYDTSDDAKIHRLQMFVFTGTGEDATYQNSKDTTIVDPVTSVKLEDLPVQSGSASLLVLANYPAITGLSSSTTLSDIMEQTVSLDQEGSVSGYKGYSMSSEVYHITIAAGKHNIIGAEDDFTSHTPQVSLSTNPVTLVRNVAKINLVSLSLKTKNEDNSDYVLPDGSKPFSFELDSIFVSNVKSVSGVASIEDWTNANSWGAVEVEMTGNRKWWFGAFNSEAYNDTLSQVSGDQNNLLLYNVADSAANNKWNYGRSLTTTTNTKISNDNGLGKSFLVYENMNRSDADAVPLGEQTILVVCGRYTRDFNGAKVTEHGYYAVPVNNKKFGAKVPEGVANHEFVKRNVKYNISLTIASTGSSTPYGWDSYAHLSAIVTVMPWNVVEIKEEVD